jgi:hypothetical protein
MFITNEDYSVQARNEILELLDGTLEYKLRAAEGMAIAQIKMKAGGRYNMEEVFSKRGDERNAFIVMITIDIAIYHLYSQKPARKIPEPRKDRYNDAIIWLDAVHDGKPTDLPLLPPEEYEGDMRIFSLYPPNNNKY